MGSGERGAAAQRRKKVRLNPKEIDFAKIRQRPLHTDANGARRLFRIIPLDQTPKTTYSTSAIVRGVAGIEPTTSSKKERELLFPSPSRGNGKFLKKLRTEKNFVGTQKRALHTRKHATPSSTPMVQQRTQQFHVWRAAAAQTWLCKQKVSFPSVPRAARHAKNAPRACRAQHCHARCARYCKQRVACCFRRPSRASERAAPQSQRPLPRPRARSAGLAVLGWRCCHVCLSSCGV
jgi:hypothetical protein